jgi:hypothetical protein
MEPLLFPRDLLKFFYWVFFKPITLSRYIREIEPTLKPDFSLFTLWKHRKQHPEFRSILALSFFHILVTPWFIFFFIKVFFIMPEGIVGWSDLMFGVILGVVFSLLGPIPMGVTGSILIGVGMSIVEGTAEAVVFSAVLGLVVGVASGIDGWRSSGRTGIWGGILIGALIGLFGIVTNGKVWGMALGTPEGVMLGMKVGIAFSASFFRLFLYVLEAPWSWLLSRHPEGMGLCLSPVTWDEIIWFPLPGLDTQLLSIARQDRNSGLEAINFVAGSFRQGWAARKAVLALMVDDIALAKDTHSISNISGTLGWLPQDLRDELKSILLGLDEISRHARAAEESETPYNRQEQLRMGLNLIERVRQGLVINSDRELGPRLVTALGTWESAFSRAYALAQEEKGIPNVYVAGSPLATQSKVFKGRRDIFRALERELVSQADQRPAILLFGARRMGKTSVLTQLPNAIGPQVIPVMVDLQSAALSDNAVSLFSKIAQNIQNSALINRSITLPDISKNALESEPYRAMSDWMEKVEKLVGERWILLCLDEYEYLEKMLLDKRIDERAFQLLRTLIQNHPRLTLLFSGAHTLEDLPPMWSNYLINVRIIKINPLADRDAEELITEPIPNFPLIYEQEALEHLLSETGCHPYLIQSTCQDLVHRLNDDNRFTANLQDVELALNSSLESGAGYFNDLWNGADCNDIQRAIQTEIAQARTGSLPVDQLEASLSRSNYTKQDIQTGLSHLIHRDVLKQENNHVQFRFELIRLWIRHQKLGLK